MSSSDDLIFPVGWPHSVSIHNVTLVGGQLSEDGATPQLIVEYQGKQHVLRATRSANEGDIGKVGYVLPSKFPSAAEHGTMIFRAYQDQSLRRVYELDTTNDEHQMVPLNHGKWPHHRAHMTCGWRCDSRPTGFLAPAGLVPGAKGEFVPDETEVVSVRIPPEFEWEARRHQMKPAELLESFIGARQNVKTAALDLARERQAHEAGARTRATAHERTPQQERQKAAREAERGREAWTLGQGMKKPVAGCYGRLTRWKGGGDVVYMALL